MYGRGACMVAVAVLLAGCTSPHHAVASRTPSVPPPAPTTTRPMAVPSSAGPVPTTATPAPPTTAAPAPPTPAVRHHAAEIAIPPATYVGRFALTPGPEVPVVTVGDGGVLVPGGKEFHPSFWGGGGLSSCDQTAVDATGRWFAYTGGHLILRVVDTHTGAVWALGKGCGPVWGPGGLAYMSTDNVDGQRGYQAWVVVRSSPLARGVVWSWGPARPLLWDGDRLLFEVGLLPADPTTLEVAAGPGHARVLPPGSRPLVRARLPLAVSPDGTRLLVEAEVTGASGAHLYLKDLELIDTTDGRVLSNLSPPGIDEVRAAVWVGRSIVLAAQTYDQNSDRPHVALARLIAGGGVLRLRQAVPESVPAGSYPGFNWYDGLQATTPGRFAAIHQQQNDTTLVSCAVVTLRCTAALRLG